MKTGMLFAGSKVSASVSMSISNDWTNSEENGVEITKSCDINSDGTPWVGGCMYEFEMDAESEDKNVVKWNSGHTRCTYSGHAPKCMPYQRCANEKCNVCLDTAEGNA